MAAGGHAFPIGVLLFSFTSPRRGEFFVHCICLWRGKWTQRVWPPFFWWRGSLIASRIRRKGESWRVWKISPPEDEKFGPPKGPFFGYQKFITEQLAPIRISNYGTKHHCKTKFLNSHLTKVKSFIWKEFWYKPSLNFKRYLISKRAYFKNNRTEIQWIFGLNFFQTIDSTSCIWI